MNHLRNAHLFDASQLHGSTAIIGCGATGSAVALQLAKLGVQNLWLYDDDLIESHNIPNQLLYHAADVDLHKSSVLAARINQMVGAPRHSNQTCMPHVTRVVAARGKLRTTRVVLCVDSMNVRREIVEQCIRYNGSTELLIDVRMGAYGGQVLACDPRQVDEYDEYMQEMYSDSAVLPQHTAACGTRPSLIHTASVLAGVATQLFTVRTTSQQRPAEVLLDMEHWTLSTRDSAALI